MKYFLDALITEDDKYGIKEALGDGRWPRQLAQDFEDTSPKAWGNIVKGKAASGKYGEIIAAIKRWKYKEACERFTVTTKNRQLRNIVVEE